MGNEATLGNYLKLLEIRHSAFVRLISLTLFFSLFYVLSPFIKSCVSFYVVFSICLSQHVRHVELPFCLKGAVHLPQIPKIKSIYIYRSRR